MDERNQTITFVTSRINHKPPVFKSMTTTEVFITFFAGSVVGLSFGIVLMLFGAIWVTAFAFTFICGLIGVFLGGFFISTLKRNKPEVWLDRLVELKLRPSKFITKNQSWSIKRSVRSIK